MENLKRQFLQPADEFTPIPFWFWNDHLTEEEIIRQINDFKEKGVMGFIIHPRIGIPKDIVYLSDRFMELVTCAVTEAEKLGMKVILYDEAMYPSGSAHGKVVAKNRKFASRGLQMAEYPVTEQIIDLVPELSDVDDVIVSIQAVKKLNEQSIDAVSTIKLQMMDGKISFIPPDNHQWSILVFIETYSQGTIRGIHFGEDDGEPNAPPSTDLLNPEAIKTYIALTHDQYYQVLKKYFGTTVIGMFTDEPAILGRRAKRGLKPWTKDFLSWYLEFGCKELDLPALWFEVGESTNHKRKLYKQAVNKKLLHSYYIPISKWCEAHGIALTGHPESSDEIGLLNQFHIPGQDVVWRWVAPEDNKALTGVHSTMGKCSSDAARHSGKRRNSNECFACCGPNGIDWGFSVADMKWYMDWLFVRGVNLLYPHAFFYSIEGKGRYDERPPDVGPNNIWWPYYRTISDYIKRMSWLMTDSLNQAKVAVLCEEDHLPWQIVKPLFENQIEFNYLENNLLESEALVEDDHIKIYDQSYQVVIIEDITHLTSRAQEKLENFVVQGGTVIVYNLNNVPLAINSVHEISSLELVVDEVRKFIKPDLLLDNPAQDLRFSHVIKNGIHFFLLVNEGERLIDRSVRLNVVGKAESWDAWNGEIKELPVSNFDEGHMDIHVSIPSRNNLLIVVDPSHVPITRVENRPSKPAEIINLSQKWIASNGNVELPMEPALICWTSIPGMENFSGSIVYKNTFQINHLDSVSFVELDFGQVHELAKLSINGHKVGVKLLAPYTFDITNHVIAGVNTVELEVVNTLANKISHAKIKSGLIGPVQIRIS